MVKRTSALLAIYFSLGAIGSAAAQTGPTVTLWTTDKGAIIRSYAMEKKVPNHNDPRLAPTVGMTLPDAVALHALPPTMNVPSPDSYGYAMVNERPVVVERETRKVIHIWEQ